MQDSKPVRLARLLNQLTGLGFTDSEAQRLRRIAMTFSRWDTEECNGTIQRDEKTGKPVRVSSLGWPSLNREIRSPIPDREAGAQKRLAAIMAAHPDLWAFHQGDPRGASLYVGRVADLKTDVNQIVRKAESWGWKGGSGFATEEIEASEYLRKRGASIPARDLLPLDQYYSKGTAICV